MDLGCTGLLWWGDRAPVCGFVPAGSPLSSLETVLHRGDVDAELGELVCQRDEGEVRCSGVCISEQV